MILLKFFCQLTLREKKHDQVFFSHLREFLSLNPKDQFGNTMLHLVTSTREPIVFPFRFYTSF